MKSLYFFIYSGLFGYPRGFKKLYSGYMCTWRYVETYIYEQRFKHVYEFVFKQTLYRGSYRIDIVNSCFVCFHIIIDKDTKIFKIKNISVYPYNFEWILIDWDSVDAVKKFISNNYNIINIDDIESFLLSLKAIKVC